MVIGCLFTLSLGMSTAPKACTPGEGLEIKEIFCDSSLREIIKTYTESHSRYDTFVVTRPILMRALKNYRYFHFIGVVRRHYRAFTRRSGNDV